MVLISKIIVFNCKYLLIFLSPTSNILRNSTPLVISRGKKVKSHLWDETRK